MEHLVIGIRTDNETLVYNNLPIKGDGDEGEDADVDAEDLHEWAKLAHELR
jgi:hypothetical protein